MKPIIDNLYIKKEKYLCNDRDYLALVDNGKYLNKEVEL